MSSDSGNISDMAVSGTTIDPSAAAPRTIRSVPNPGQAQQADDPDYNSSTGLAGAATNSTDIPRSTRDTATTGEVETISGRPLDASVESKRLTNSAGDKDLAKGSLRYEKHARQNGADEERLAGQGPEVEAAPGEEEVGQEELRDRRDGGA